MNETYDSPQVQHTVERQAEKAKTEAREAVELLEQARGLMAKDGALQPAMEHLHAAIHEAKGRAATLEDWYGAPTRNQRQRTYVGKENFREL